jgi:hypothetical protein
MDTGLGAPAGQHHRSLNGNGVTRFVTRNGVD